MRATYAPPQRREGSSLPKYEINEDNRIVALETFGIVIAGQVGGVVDGEHNLSQYGLSWISYNSSVTGDAMVFDDANLLGSCHLIDQSLAYGQSTLFGNVLMQADSRAFGSCRLRGATVVPGNAWVFGEAVVENTTLASGDRIGGFTRIGL